MGCADLSLLSIIRDVCRLTSLPVPDEVVNSRDIIVQQLYALANEEGNELATSHDWQKLTRQHLFTTTNTEEQDTAVPDDWDRFIANSFWDRTKMRPLIGPVTPQKWQALKAYPAAQNYYISFRERDGKFLCFPNPSAGDDIAYEYVSKNWAKTQGGVPIPEFVSDTDETYLPEKLFKLGVRWRFLKSKGIDYAQDFDTYQRELQKSQGFEQGSTALSIAPRRGQRWLATPSVVIGVTNP